MRLRQVRAEEWAQLRDLRLRALADAPSAFLRTLAEEVELPDEVWMERASPSRERVSYVAQTETRELVGMVVGLFDAASRTVRVVGMWVAPEERRRGLGRALLEMVVARAREGGARRVELEVNEASEPATRLYASAGFVPTGAKRPLPTDPTVTAVTMVLDLGA